MSYSKVEFYRGNIEGRGEALEYYGAAAQIATRPVIITMIIISNTNEDNKDSDDDDYDIQRCCQHGRTPRNFNTMEPQRLRTVASLTRFPLDRSADEDDLLLMMIASIFMPGSAPTEGFC